MVNLFVDGELLEQQQLSASACRQVHSDILASVTRIKCSLLGRKGGLLHGYYSASASDIANKEQPDNETTDQDDNGKNCCNLWLSKNIWLKRNQTNGFTDM